jgi:hypothetical protein
MGPDESGFSLCSNSSIDGIKIFSNKKDWVNGSPLDSFYCLGMNPQWLNTTIEWQKLIRERVKNNNQVKILRETT